jgi:gamma-glutamylcyclotransferase (GGCT)/AIG2-like uncharacterized protein YtfP
MTKSKLKFLPDMRIFVYGTLKPGEANYQKYCAGLVINTQRAFVHGDLFALPMGYPAMTFGNGQVQGYLLSFLDSGILKALDDLEGYQPDRSMSENIYNREYIQIFSPQHLSLGEAWSYLMNLDQVKRLGGISQSDGWWSGCGLTPNCGDEF